MVKDELHRLIDEVLGDDARRALVAYRDLSDRQLPWLEQRVVSLARRERMSWGTIATMLGRSRQGLQQRFRVIAPKPAPAPLEDEWDATARKHEDAFMAALRRMQNKQRRGGGDDGEIDDDPVAW